MSAKKTIVIATGGTGGHIFPATSLAEKLLSEDANYKIIFMGGNLSKNPYFNPDSFDFEDIPAATFSFKNPVEALKKGKIIWQGIAKSRKLLKMLSPDLVVGFGSYYSLPVLAGAFSLKIPLILHEQNAIPGKVNRLFSRVALKTAITFPESTSFLKGKCETVAFPLRFSFPSLLKEEALKHFSLQKGKLTILILGGSQGAKSINHLVFDALSELRDTLAPFQVIHLAGKEADICHLKKKWESADIFACVQPFEKRMDLAWSAADLAIARGGASSLAEQIASKTPGVIIPYPFSAENHQEKNGAHFVDQVKGGLLFHERLEKAEALKKRILIIVENLDSFTMNLANHLENQQIQTFNDFIIRHL